MTSLHFSPDCGFVQMFRVRQSSPTFVIVAALPPTFSKHPRPNLVAEIVLLLLNGLGEANLRSPIGGSANGIPRYSDTAGFQSAACPVTVPLEVLTAWPIDQ